MDSKKGKHSKQSNQKKSSKGQVNPDLVAEYVREEIPKSKSQKRKAPSQPHNSGKQSADGQKGKGKKDKASQVYPMCSWSNIELIVWTVLVAAVGTIYHKLMMRIYSVEAWNDFDHFAKVLINHFGFCKV
jgi:hypothetical protein